MFLNQNDWKAPNSKLLFEKFHEEMIVFKIEEILQK